MYHLINSDELGTFLKNVVGHVLKLYEVINYFYLYVSMTKSLYSCCLRFILTVVFSVLSQDRLDTTIYSRDKQKFDTAHRTYIAMLRTLPEVYQHLLKGQAQWPRGTVLGGCSSVNNMAYVRGSRHYYDRWAETTKDETWNYEHVLS
ncbi:hypothetical protein Btru_017511 [Bulinus truncatus]|nr:hypothetical protein Btru_017511 [Bulinus truncatus]